MSRTGGLAAALLGLALVASASTPLARVDDAPRAVVFKPAKAADPGWRAAACATVAGGCGEDRDGDTVAALYTAPKLPAGGYYAILDAGPTLVALSLDAQKRWRVGERWSLAGYRHTDVPTSDMGADPHPFRIHPALYPLGPGEWGVALVSRHAEAYSGGGAGFHIADFISLKDIAASAKAARPVYGGVPFSCSKMVRACFSERDYTSSPHCHDEYAGALRIRYAPGKPRHAWTFVWTQTDWPQGVRQSRATTTTDVVPATPGKQFGANGKTFPFCDGGPIG